MKTYANGDEDEPDPDGESLPDKSAGPLLSGVPLSESDHGEILRAIIAEGAEAAIETWIEAKDPNIDPALKIKLIGLASSVGDNVRKAIGTHATHFRGED